MFENDLWHIRTDILFQVSYGTVYKKKAGVSGWIDCIPSSYQVQPLTDDKGGHKPHP